MLVRLLVNDIKGEVYFMKKSIYDELENIKDELGWHHYGEVKDKETRQQIEFFINKLSKIITLIQADSINQETMRLES